MTSDGKAKRVNQKDFPIQGRYGKGVVAWDLPHKVTLAAMTSGKPNYMATIHLSKGAPKSTRLDGGSLYQNREGRAKACEENGKHKAAKTSAKKVTKPAAKAKAKPAKGKKK